VSIVIGADIKTDGSELERQLRRDASTIERTLGGSFKTVGKLAALPFTTVSKLTRATTGLVGKLTRIDNIVRGAAIAVVGQKLFQALDRNIQSTGALLVQTQALANQTGKTQRQVNDYISTINDGSLGLLDFSIAAQAANRALLAKIPQDKIAQIAKFSAIIATARGESDRFQQSFPGLIKQLATGETGELKDFGIFIDPADLSGLSFDERRVRVLELALTQLEDKSKKLGTTGKEVFFVYNSIFGNIQDIRVELGKSVVESGRIKAVIGGIADLTSGIAQSLRDFGIAETIGPLFEKLIQVGGAFAADLGEAIALGVGRGFKAGLELLGFSLADLFGNELAESIGASLGKTIDFGRTRQRAGELVGAFASSGKEVVSTLDPFTNRRESFAAQQRLREVSRGLRLGTGRGRVFSDASDRVDQKAKEDGEFLTTSERRARVFKELEKERQRLRAQLGFGRPGIDANAKTPQGLVSATTGTDADDTLGQRIGKALVTGFLTGKDELQAVFVEAIDEGLVTGLGKITDSVGGLMEDGAAVIAGAITNLDWTLIGNKIGGGILRTLIIDPVKGKLSESAEGIGAIKDIAAQNEIGRSTVDILNRDFKDSLIGKFLLPGFKNQLPSRSQRQSVGPTPTPEDLLGIESGGDTKKEMDEIKEKTNQQTESTKGAAESVSDATDAVDVLSNMFDRFTTALS